MNDTNVRFLTPIIGSCKKYQWFLYVLVSMGNIGVAYQLMAVIYSVPPVSYTCPNNTRCCDNPTFDTSVFKRTIATEFRLICDKSWLKSFFQTLFQLGVMLGSLMFGIASDRLVPK